jgi:putative FmdB family regulatory protein
MPTYVYHCNRCGKHIELVRSFDAASEIAPVCDECQAAMQKVYQVAYVVYKGDVWYVADKGKAAS